VLWFCRIVFVGENLISIFIINKPFQGVQKFETFHHLFDDKMEDQDGNTPDEVE